MNDRPTRVQQPGGPSTQENQKLGLPRQLRIDTSRNELRIHDGVTVGGHRIPNISAIAQMITEATQSTATGALVLFATRTALANAIPGTDIFAVLTETGFEDVFTWQAGIGGNDTIASAVDGHWKRVSSSMSFIASLWKSGLVAIQIGGTEPAAAQNQTLWYTEDEMRAWNGTTYVEATPALFARALRTQTVGETLANLNNVIPGIQFHFVNAASNKPAGITAGVTWAIPLATNNDDILQIAIAANASYATRTRIANAWSAWASIAIAISQVTNLQTTLNNITTSITNLDAEVTAAIADLDTELTNAINSLSSSTSTALNLKQDKSATWYGTQAAYDAIAVKDANVEYNIYL